MNKSELVDDVAERASLDKRTAEAALNALLDALMTATKAGDRVSIPGFGTFNPTSRAARIGRNPQTGEPVKIAASKGVRFAPGTKFKELLNPKSGAKKAAPAKKTAKKAGKTTKKR